MPWWAWRPRRSPSPGLVPLRIRTDGGGGFCSCCARSSSCGRTFMRRFSCRACPLPAARGAVRTPRPGRPARFADHAWSVLRMCAMASSVDAGRRCRCRRLDSGPLERASSMDGDLPIAGRVQPWRHVSFLSLVPRAGPEHWMGSSCHHRRDRRHRIDWTAARTQSRPTEGDGAVRGVPTHVSLDLLTSVSAPVPSRALRHDCPADLFRGVRRGCGDRLAVETTGRRGRHGHRRLSCGRLPGGLVRHDEASILPATGSCGRAYAREGGGSWGPRHRDLSSTAGRLGTTRCGRDSQAPSARFPAR